MIDYRDWGVPLGRRFRALKLWFVLRSYGVERLQAMLRDHIAWTAELAAADRAEPDFELVTPARLALLTFRYRPQEIDDDAALDRAERAPAARAERRAAASTSPRPACAAATSSASRSASSHTTPRPHGAGLGAIAATARALPPDD